MLSIDPYIRRIPTIENEGRHLVSRNHFTLADTTVYDNQLYWAPLCDERSGFAHLVRRTEPSEVFDKRNVLPRWTVAEIAMRGLIYRINRTNFEQETVTVEPVRDTRLIEKFFMLIFLLT